MNNVVPLETPRALRAKIAELSAELEQHQLKHGSGDGTSGGMSDDWKISVDRQLGQLHGDVRGLLYGLIGGFLFLIAGGVAGYLLLDGRFGSLESKLDIRITKVEDRLTSLERKVDSIDTKIGILLERKREADGK